MQNSRYNLLCSSHDCVKTIVYPNNWLEDAATKWKVDPDRLIAWHAFSKFYLDTWHDESYLQQVADELADTALSIEELSHIAFFEVMPVCISNILWAWWPGAEWTGFDDDWLIPKCVQCMKNRPFRSSGHRNAPSRYLRMMQPFWLDSYCMVQRVVAIRASRR